MKIGSYTVEETVEFDEPVEETGGQVSVSLSSRVPNVVLKYTGYPPNCDPADCVSTKEFPYMKFSMEYFNPIQSAFLKEYYKDNNIVVCGATSCGKTVIAEMAAAHTLEEVRKTYPDAKVAYISPLKALASEKQQDWTSSNHAFYKYNISILTGDFILTNERKKELAAANIICMSSEMLGSRIRRRDTEKNTFLSQIRVLIVDEAHLMGVDTRGPALEVALMKFTQANHQCKIIFLSATMPNVEQLGAWLTLLNGKPSTLVKSDYRPVDLVWNWELFSARGGYKEVEYNKVTKVVEILCRYPNDKFLVFVHSKNVGRKIMHCLKEMGVVAEFHNADLSYEDRSCIEQAFKSRELGSLRVVVATSTLAWGLNFPARRVIIVGIHRGLGLIDPLDISQEGGRAGRVGRDKFGDVHVLIRDTHREEDIEFCKQILPVLSKISDKTALAFHLVNEITERTVTNYKQAVVWFSRSLSHFQQIIETVEKSTVEVVLREVIAELEKFGAITIEDGKFSATIVGKVASWFYFNPYDVSYWVRNLKRIMEDPQPPSNEKIAWALGHTYTSQQGYPSREADALLENIQATLTRNGLPYGKGSDKHCAAMYCLLTGKESKMADINMLAFRYKMDSERITSAIRMLQKIGKCFEHTSHPHLIYELPIRVRYGLGDKALDLLVLPGIGRKTAEIIMSRGIYNCKQLLAAQTVGVKVLTDTKWEKIRGHAEEVAMLGHIEYLKKHTGTFASDDK